MRNKPFRFFLLTFLVLLVSFLPACTSQGDQAGPGEEEELKTLKVGVLGPFTGPSERTGQEFKISTQMAFEAIDYTVGDYTIELVWIDSQSDPDKAVQAYEQAIIEEGIQVGVLNWHSDVAVATMEVTAEHQIPHFFGFGATETVNEIFESDPQKYGYWGVKGWPSPVKLSRNYVTALEDAIKEGLLTLEAKKAAIYGEDTTWGRSFGEGIAGQLEEAGWEIVDRQYFPLEETDFEAIIAGFKEKDVDLIAGTSTVPDSLAALIKQADAAELDALIIADGLGWVGKWYELTGDASNYVIDQIPRWTTEAAQTFAADFEERSGLTPSPSSAGLSYDGANFLIEVLEATYRDYGELNNETVHATQQNKIWTGELTYSLDDGAIVMNEYNFSDPPDPLVGGEYYTFPILQYIDGEALAIWPDSFAEAELQTKP
jgi:branched-chain amino acid transport system substrate-binding protein